MATQNAHCASDSLVADDLMLLETCIPLELQLKALIGPTGPGENVLYCP